MRLAFAGSKTANFCADLSGSGSGSHCDEAFFLVCGQVVDGLAAIPGQGAGPLPGGKVQEGNVYEGAKTGNTRRRFDRSWIC
jgi:hypothetical protein